MFSTAKDFQTAIAKAGGGGRLVAAGTGDNTKITGQAIDRYGASGVQRYDQAKIAVNYHAVLTDTKTLSIATEIAYSSDGTNFDTAVVLEASAVKATAANPALEFHGVVEFNVDLSGQKRYFRVNVTPDLNASGTDTAEVITAVVLSGGATLPAT